ncbi:hypothetical protein BCR42DRAFT_430376, partial [Absidia repens]
MVIGSSKHLVRASTLVHIFHWQRWTSFSNNSNLSRLVWWISLWPSLMVTLYMVFVLKDTVMKKKKSKRMHLLY